jgi:hypothetical protein
MNKLIRSFYKIWRLLIKQTQTNSFFLQPATKFFLAYYIVLKLTQTEQKDFFLAIPEVMYKITSSLSSDCATFKLDLAKTNKHYTR